MTFLNTQHTIYSISSRSMYVLTQSLACPVVTLVDTRSCGSQLEWLFKDPSKFKAYLGSSQCYMPFSKQELESRSIWPSGNHPDGLHQRPARWQRWTVRKSSCLHVVSTSVPRQDLLPFGNLYTHALPSVIRRLSSSLTLAQPISELRCIAIKKIYVISSLASYQ